MRRVNYEDSDGRMSVREIPDSAPDGHAEKGVLVGPPEFEFLPKETAIRLTNELFNRNIITFEDARRRRPELQAALQAALRLDVETIQLAFREG